ncbi:MAG: hypothetical protein E7D48_04230 [Bifidobacterium scardovii]|jgi:hypothetical protein|uniref:hypothetical protein n=1 Tax=Bifidobacterium scardovii TaxID=158787 RepID=UPI00290454A1|nr:hypothetical protein [Bifidobacterium scardovii]MDU2421309.1 hypothetical protein [Bifidobacterium scardovii]
MVDQIVDLIEATMPGPMGEVTGEAKRLLEQAREAAALAEAYASDVKEKTDEAVALLVESGALTGAAVDARAAKRDGYVRVFSQAADLQSDEARAMPNGSMAYVSEEDAWYARTQTSERWWPLVTGQRRWAGSDSSNTLVRALVNGVLGQVQVFGRPTTLASKQSLDLGITVPEGMRPYQTASMLLASDDNASNLQVTLEVRADTGKVMVRNRGGSALNNVPLYGTLTWLAES